MFMFSRAAFAVDDALGKFRRINFAVQDFALQDFARAGFCKSRGGLIGKMAGRIRDPRGLGTSTS